MIPSSRFSGITDVNMGKEWIKDISRTIERVVMEDRGQEVEIEFKYAIPEIKTELDFREFERWKPPSFYTVLNLGSVNPHLKLRAGFKEPIRFYSMKQLLMNICAENTKKKEYPTVPSYNYFRSMSNSFDNSQISLKQEQLRVDINCQGTRYTYTHGKGWSVIIKDKSLESYNLLYCQNGYRLTLSTEKKEWKEREKIKEELEKVVASGEKKYGIRFKNLVKFEKGETIELCLSEILVHNDCLQQIIERTQSYEDLDNYLVNMFANYYTVPMAPDKTWEIESQITQEGISKIRNLIKQKRFVQYEAFLELIIQDLNSLYHSEYCIKKEEMKALKAKYVQENKEPPKLEQRMNNCIGSYMHSELANFMREYKY